VVLGASVSAFALRLSGSSFFTETFVGGWKKVDMQTGRRALAEGHFSLEFLVINYEAAVIKPNTLLKFKFILAKK
jgi:hypothetical protein